MGDKGVGRQRVMARYFCKMERVYRGVTWDRGEEEIEGWLLVVFLGWGL